MSLPQNVITASYLPSPQYYREIFPAPMVITMVTTVLLLSPLPCYPVVTIKSKVLRNHNPAMVKGHNHLLLAV